MEKKKKKSPPFILFVVAAVIVSFVISFFKEGMGLFRPLLYIAKLVYIAVMNTPGEDLAAIYLVVIVFSVGAVAGIGILIPRVKLGDEKRTKITLWALHLIRLGIALVPVAAAAVVGIKLSPWFVVPVLIVALSGSLYLIAKFWLLKLRKRKRERD